MSFLPNTFKFSFNAPVGRSQKINIFSMSVLIVWCWKKYIWDRFIDMFTYLTSSPCSSNTMISSTQNTTQARAICPARYVRSSVDWALSSTEPGRATLTVYGRPKVTQIACYITWFTADWSKGDPWNDKLTFFALALFKFCSLCRLLLFLLLQLFDQLVLFPLLISLFYCC